MSKAVRRGVGRRLAMLVGMAALMVGFSASIASASVNLSPAGPYSSTEPTPVKVFGESKYAGTTHVSVAVCNVKSGVIPGTRCDVESATAGLRTLADYEEEEVTINVQRGAWQDWNFTTGSPTLVPGSFTTCRNTSGVGDPCSVIVSFYEETESGFEQLGPETKSILFE